ncbi:Uncharacterised protein [Neisseria mucosa]|nr:Uncharacterised protein [Neisseria mucosa]
MPAAFGRLCVETKPWIFANIFIIPAAFGRLCVETILHKSLRKNDTCQPPSGGCVLKLGV